MRVRVFFPTLTLINYIENRKLVYRQRETTGSKLKKKVDYQKKNVLSLSFLCFATIINSKTRKKTYYK